MSQWRKKALRGKLSNRIVYVAAEDHCWRIDAGTCDLNCNQEEADTSMVLLAHHSEGTCVGNPR